MPLFAKFIGCKCFGTRDIVYGVQKLNKQFEKKEKKIANNNKNNELKTNTKLKK